METLTPEIIGFYSAILVAFIGSVATVVVAIVNKPANKKEEKPEIPRGTVIDASADIDFLAHLRKRNEILLAQDAEWRVRYEERDEEWRMKYEAREEYWQGVVANKDRKITKLLILLAKHDIDPPF